MYENGSVNRPFLRKKTKNKNDGRAPKKKKDMRAFKRIFKKFISLAAFAGVSLILFGMVFAAWVSRDLPNPDKISEREVPLSTKIYDRTGETVLYNIHGEQKRTFVKLEDIPDSMKHATLTAEDRRFYEHGGISLTGILRSIYKNITTGSKVSGSTLTQQFIKNAVLTSEKTYSRKIKEIILSYRIEQKFTKDEILQLYFNEIPYGSTAYGIEAAAQTYFGKSIRDATLAESAILAGLPKAPTYYSPYGNNRDQLIIRQHWILDGMVEEGYITQEEAEAAKEQELEFKRSAEDIIAPHFVTYVREYLSNKYGEKTVEQEGLTVITTLDLDKQEIAQDVVSTQAEKNLRYDASNAALVSIDARTGEILAMVGSKDFFDEEIDGQVNVVTRPRQPGSSFKPIVYAAAFRKGYTADTILYDVETTFINYDLKPYTPKNYNLTEHGLVTMRKALAGSLNIPAVKTIYLTGITNVLDLADDLGYTTLKQRSRFGLSLVLGGGEVTLLEHVAAYATFAREGERPDISAILEIRDKDGNVLEEFKSNETKVLETEVARQLINVMSDNDARAFSFGAVNPLTLPGRPVAAKTGTTNDFRDAWTIGFTPSVATGVWVGNNDFSAMGDGAAGANVAGPIWQQYMTRALEGTPVESFTKPKPVRTDNPALNGELKEGVVVKIDKISGKLATEFTPPELIEEKTFQLEHSILHYVDKDDPRGSQPSNPASDPQYAAWEEAVKTWAEKNEVTLEKPPTESDDVHLPKNKPELSILQPLKGETISERQLAAQVYVSAPLGMQKVEYYLNGQLLRTSIVSPFSLSTQLSNPYLTNGTATLKAIAYDSAGNTARKEVDVNLALPPATSIVRWQIPNSGQIVSESDYPLFLQLGIENPQNISEISLYLDQGTGADRLLHTFTDISTTQRSFQWATYPGAGTVGLYATVKNTNGSTYNTPDVILDVK